MDFPLQANFAANVNVESRDRDRCNLLPGYRDWLLVWRPNSYSSHGMLAKVNQRRTMSFNVGPTEAEQGTISPDVVTREQIYNYPLGPDSALTYAPTYTKKTETWDGMDTPPTVTRYVMQLDATPRRMETTYPDGAHREQLSVRAAHPIPLRRHGSQAQGKLRLQYGLSGFDNRHQRFDSERRVLRGLASARGVWWSGTPGLEHTVFEYDDAALTVTEALLSLPVPSPGGPSHIATTIAQTVRHMNGLGLVRQQETRAEETIRDVF